MSTNLYSCFAQIHDLVINGSTSPLGELSQTTSSYAKEPDIYFKDNTGVDLYSFRGVSETSMFEKIPDSHNQPVIDMLHWLLEQAKGNKTTDNAQSCLQLLKTQFTNGWEWEAVNVMVTNNEIWLPSSITFKYTAAGLTHEFRIWFANEYFAYEFPYRDIYVIHPIPVEDIDYLADHNYKQIQQRLYEETPDKIEERVNKTLVEPYPPYSYRMVMNFDVYDLVNNKSVRASWTVIIYGNPNDAEEEIYEKIKECILNNSEHTEDEWSDIIPDLFNPLEFAIVPYWNELGLINETALGSTYSPILTYKGGDALPLQYGALWGNDTAIEFMQVVPHLYKSAKMAFIGKPKNHNDKHHVTDVYPDYQLIPSTDSQAGMVSRETSKFIKDLEEMLAAGEVVTPDGMPPRGMQRVMRNDKLYLTKRSGRTRFTMITRYQFVKDGVINE